MGMQGQYRGIPGSSESAIWRSNKLSGECTYFNTGVNMGPQEGMRSAILKSV
jgi:hypothetical protein